MSLLPLLAVAGAGTAITLVLGTRPGSGARVSGALGAIALLIVLILAVSLPAADPTLPGSVPDAAGALERLLRPTDYLRLVVGVWTIDGLLVLALGALLGGLGALPVALLGGLAGTIVALASTDLLLAGTAATAASLTGLLATRAAHDDGDRAKTPPTEPDGAVSPKPQLVPSSRAESLDRAGRRGSPRPEPGRVVATQARELQVLLLAGLLVVAGALVAESAAAVLAVPRSGAGQGGGAAVVGLMVLAMAAAVAVRGGAVPFHLRVARLADVAPPASLGVLLGWAPLALLAVALAGLDRLVVPLALPLDAERWVIAAVAVLTLAAATFAASVRDDVRHIVGYLAVADVAIVLLAFVALDPAAWGPARTWLLVLAASKAALAAWALVLEARFGSSRLGDVRGWARRAPLLAVALTVAVLAAFGLPGWTAWQARWELSALAGGTLAPLLWVLTMAPLAAYVRLLAGGMGRPAGRIDGTAGERFLSFGTAPATPPVRRTVAAAAIAGVAADLRANEALLSSALVLAVAVVGALVAWGVMDLSGAAAQPAPATVPLQGARG
jgi:hypothetical protein